MFKMPGDDNVFSKNCIHVMPTNWSRATTLNVGFVIMLKNANFTICYNILILCGFIVKPIVPTETPMHCLLQTKLCKRIFTLINYC